MTAPGKLRRVGARVHIDTDNKEWGRVASNGIILEVFKREALIQVESIRSNILVPLSDIAGRAGGMFIGTEREINKKLKGVGKALTEFRKARTKARVTKLKRLCEAAPDLLLVLRRAHHWAIMLNDQRTIPWIEDAETAIIKATGSRTFRVPRVPAATAQRLLYK